MERVAIIESRLRAAFAPQRLEVKDDSAKHAGHAGARSGGGHFSVTIVSHRFDGQSSLARHRLIYQALGELMHHDIHALSIEALSPNEL